MPVLLLSTPLYAFREAACYDQNNMHKRKKISMGGKDHVNGSEYVGYLGVE